MDKSEVIAKLSPIASEVFKIDNIVLADSMSAENIEQWTSLSFMTFLAEIEQNFGFKFKMMEVLRLKTMGDIIDAIAKHLS